MNQTPQYQNSYFPQWNFDPGTTAPPIPSPTSTVNTTRCTSKSRLVARSNATQSRSNALQAHSDGNSQFLVPSGPQQYSLTQNADQMVDSISRLCHSEGPWNPHQMRSSNVNTGHHTVPYAHEDLSQYRQGIRSDIDIVSDSGYQTHPAQSVVGNESGSGGQELPGDFMLQTRNMDVNIAQDTPHKMARTSSDQRSVSQYSSRSGRHRQQYRCSAPDCSVISKCPSEHKYVSNATYAELLNLTVALQETYAETREDTHLS